MNVLIEGLGSIAQKHITALRELIPNVVIYGLRSSTNSNEIEGIISIFSYDQLPLKPDFIIICTPTQFHREGIRNAMNLGVPIMIEKPAFHTIEESDKVLVNELVQKKIKTYVACNLRFHSVLIALNGFLKENKNRINEVNVYCGSYFPDWRPNRDYKNVYSAKNDVGGGIHLELIHELDYTLWLFGFPLNSKRVLASKSTIDIEAADYAHYLLEYQTFFATITLNFYRRKIKRSIEILFENETWTVDLINASITNDKNEIIFSSDFKVMDTYLLQMKHMLDIVNNKAESLNSIHNAIDTLKICLVDG
jgi:predicted dehydrogenase